MAMKINNSTTNIVSNMLANSIPEELIDNPTIKDNYEDLDKWVQSIECPDGKTSKQYRTLSDALHEVDHAILELRTPEDQADENMVSYFQHKMQNLITTHILLTDLYQQAEAYVTHQKHQSNFFDIIVEFDRRLRAQRQIEAMLIRKGA